jgi:hypothetical protein
MDALAWGLGAPVPSLPTVALLLLMLALAGITAARLGRRPMGTA